MMKMVGYMIEDNFYADDEPDPTIEIPDVYPEM